MNPDIRSSEGISSVYTGEPAVEIREGEFPETESWWRRVARWSLYATAFLTPLLFLPSTIPPTFVKQVAVSLFAFTAFIAWLGESLLSGRIYYKRSLINPAIGILLLALFLSTLMSAQSLRGLVGADDIGERFMSFLVFAVIFFVAGGVFYTERESKRLVWWLLGGGGALAVLSLFQFFAPQLIPIAALARADASPVGTANAVAMVSGLFFLFASGILASGKSAIENVWIKGGVIAVLILTLLNLVVVNFRYVWLGVAVGLVVLLGLQFRIASRSVGEFKSGAFLRRKGFGFLFLLLAVSIFFTLSNFALFSGTSLIRTPSIPVEVGPSYQATLDVAKQAIQKSPIFGSGPGTFGLDYSSYRNPQINQTTFWGIRFNSGSAFMPTSLATTGALGVVALVLFSLVALFSLVRGIANRVDDDPILAGGLAAALFGFLMWWLYTTTFTSQVALFATLGILMARLDETSADGEKKSIWRISERSASFTTPWSTFATSLWWAVSRFFIIRFSNISRRFIFRAGLRHSTRKTMLAGPCSG